MPPTGLVASLRVTKGAMATLENSHRTVLKATHTAIDISPDRADRLHRVLEKSGYVRALAIQDGEVGRIRQTADPDCVLRDQVWSTLQQFEVGQSHLTVPDQSVIAGLSMEELKTFGEMLVVARSRMLDRPAAEKRLDRNDLRRSPVSQYGNPAALYQVAKAALSNFTQAMTVSPIGLLHLERIEMSPAGVERGELIGTIPLAPGETTAVEQKEWTVTEEELSTIVTDSLEEYTEKGVTEKSELAQATTSESKRSQQLGVGATMSGSYGFVTFSTSTNVNSALEATASTKASRTQAAEVTSKVSSRVRKERKVTIQTKTTTGSQETTTREIRNTSATDGLRIDYFSMMRRWRVRLLQYGLRQTYDIAIPSPGATLRQVFQDIQSLTAQIDGAFTFDLKVTDIDRSNYRDLAAARGAAVPEPPSPGFQVRVGGPVPGLDHGTGWHFNSVDLEVPDNYEVNAIVLDALLGNVDNDNPGPRTFIVFGYGSPRRNSAGNPTSNALGENGRAAFLEDMTAEAGFMKGARGRQTLQYFIQQIDAAAVTFVATFEPTAESLSHWQFAVWQALRDAAAAAHYTQAQTLIAQRDALLESITDVDTLTLRREEHYEIMRNVLHWLLGPAFEFMPDEIAALFEGPPEDRISLTGSDLHISEMQWGQMFRYQEMIKFLHQAIEWENLLYFVYPYFWDVPRDWEFARTIEHPDMERQQFLRAGSARVVLTVRPGFEEPFAAFVDTGSFGHALPPDHPYLTIGKEIAAYSQTNYPGVPPANPSSGYRPLLSPAQRKAWADIVALIAALDAWRDAHGGTYPTTAQGLAVLPGALSTTDPWGAPYIYAAPGRAMEFELSSAGEDGVHGPNQAGIDDDVTSWAPASLVGEWFEYTPTRGVDIAVNTVLADLA